MKRTRKMVEVSWVAMLELCTVEWVEWEILLRDPASKGDPCEVLMKVLPVGSCSENKSICGLEDSNKRIRNSNQRDPVDGRRRKVESQKEPMRAAESHRKPQRTTKSHRELQRATQSHTENDRGNEERTTERQAAWRQVSNREKKAIAQPSFNSEKCPSNFLKITSTTTRPVSSAV